MKNNICECDKPGYPLPDHGECSKCGFEMMDKEEELKCESCSKEISFKVAHASLGYLRKMLCIECQRKEVIKTYFRQPELMKMKLTELGKYTSSST